MRQLLDKAFDNQQWWYPWLMLAIMCSTVMLVGWGLSWYIVGEHAPAFFYQDIGPTATPTEVCN